MKTKKWQLSEKKKPLVAALLALGFKEQKLDHQYYNHKRLFYSWSPGNYTNTINVTIDNTTSGTKVLESILNFAHSVGQSHTRNELQDAVASIRSFLRL